MLTGFRVQNFKAFQDTNTIGLAPLTLLSGINSAGKSSLMQMLLLLKQTLESGPSQALNPGQGPFLEQSLGDNFNDFLFAHPKLDEASLVYHLDFAYRRDNDDEVELYDALNALLSDLDVESLKKILHHDLLSSSVVIEFGWGPYGFRGRPTVRVAKLEISLSVGKQPIVGPNQSLWQNTELSASFSTGCDIHLRTNHQRKLCQTTRGKDSSKKRWSKPHRLISKTGNLKSRSFADSGQV